MKIKRNDMVKILYGKDSGKTGKVLRVLQKENKVIVEGLNMFKRHMKGDGKQRKSEIVDLIKPMNIAKVMVICPSCKKPVRVGMQDKQRVCKKCWKKIDTVVEKKEAKKKVKDVKSKKTVKK